MSQWNVLVLWTVLDQFLLTSNVLSSYENYNVDLIKQSFLCLQTLGLFCALHSDDPS